MAKSIDEKTRKLASQRPEAGKEFQQMQAAQNQLLEIQGAQKQNLMEQKMMAGAEAEQRQLMAQAAEVGAGSVAGNMQLNQATQQAMGRYGLAQPRTSSTTKQTQSQSITRQNVTIHNNTTNITNNTVPANIGGPLQGRPIQFQQPVPGSDASGGMGKFKNWLNQTFARQEEAAKRRNREYERRETSLTKNSNKMMRKLEEFSKDITKKLDPRNVGKTMGGQLRTILGLLGLGVIAKNFNKLLDWLEGAQNKVENEYIPNIKNFFAWVKGDEDARRPGFVTKLTEGIEKTFGKLLYGKDYTPNGSLAEGGLLKSLSKYFWNTETGENRGILNKAFDYIKEEFQRRSKMAKEAIVLNNSATWSEIFKSPMDAMKELLTNLTNYVGVLIGGDAVMSRIQGDVVSRSAATYSVASDREQKRVDKSWRFKVGETVVNADQGDIALLGSGKITSVPQEYMDSSGHINGSVGSTIAVSNNIARIGYQAHRGDFHAASFANNFSELHRVAKEQGYIVVSKDLLEGNDAISESIRNGNIKRIDGNKFHYVLRPRPAKDIQKEAKAIGKVQEFEEALMACGMALTVVTEGVSYFVAAGIAGALAFYNECKLKGIHTHTIAIVRDDEIINGIDIDLGPLSQSGNDSWKDLYVITEEALEALAKSIFLTQEQIEAGETVSFSTGDKDFVLAGQRFLESLNETTNANYNGFSAESMTDYSRKERKKKEPEVGHHLHRDPEGSGDSSTGHHLIPGLPAASDTGHHLLTQEQIDAAKKSEGKTGGLLTQEQINAGVTRSSSPENSQATTPDSSEPSQEDRSYTTSSNDKFIYGAEGAFDPEAAAKWVAANYSERSKGIAGGLCSDFVGMGLRNGGSGAPGAGTVSNLEDYLISHGWYDTGLGPNDRELWQVGDVSIIYKKRGKRNGNGHTSMYVGNGWWISDVKHSQYSGGWEGCEEIHIYRYRNDPSVSHTGSPGREWNRRPNVNHVKYAVDRWWRLGRSKERWGGVGALFAGTNGRSYNRVPGDKEEVRQVLENPDSTIADFIRVAYKPITTETKWSPTEIAQMYGSGVNVRDVSDVSFNGSTDDSFFGKVKNKASDFFGKAKEVVKEAVGGLVHKVGEGTEWEADIHGGLANYDYGTGGRRSDIENVMYGKYSGNERQLYDVLPKSIIKGTTSDRNEWWGGFFDHEGNLKIKDSDKVNPEIMKALTDIESELKKGNGMDEVQLQLAATSLDNAMQYNAGQTARERRLINALTVPQSMSVPSMTENNTDGI